MRDQLPLEKELIPYSYDITLGEDVFLLEYNYNALHDLFSVNLYRDGELLCAGERLVYGQPLFECSTVPGVYPGLRIVPLDEAGIQDTVTWQNVGDTVFLTIDDEEG